MAKTARPLIGIPCCRRMLNDFAFHIAGEKYVTAVLGSADGLPVLIPALGLLLPVEDLVARLDGLLLTGSPSNVEPHHYDGPPPPPNNPTDPARDATTLPLIRAAVAAGIPVLGICRGLQELNVALGGTLHQQVHAVPGRFDHREEDGPVDHRYRPVHPIELVPGGFLAGLSTDLTVEVNSLHGQGVETPAPGVVVEAWAPDGQIEAIRREASDFCVGVQWHPEYRATERPLSRALFAAFGAACRAFAAKRTAEL